MDNKKPDFTVGEVRVAMIYEFTKACGVYLQNYINEQGPPDKWTIDQIIKVASKSRAFSRIAANMVLVMREAGKADGKPGFDEGDSLIEIIEGADRRADDAVDKFLTRRQARLN